jgi:hypothetical protein
MILLLLHQNQLQLTHPHPFPIMVVVSLLMAIALGTTERNDQDASHCLHAHVSPADLSLCKYSNLLFECLCNITGVIVEY